MPHSDNTSIQETGFKPVSFSHNKLNIYSVNKKFDLLSLQKSKTERYPFLLESVAHSFDEKNEACSSRFDILFAFPQATLKLSNDGVLTGLENTSGNDFLDNLSNWWQQEAENEIVAEALPFTGGWFMYLGYELAQQVEQRLQLNMPEIPVAYACRIPAAIIYDHELDITYVCCEESYDCVLELINDLSGINTRITSDQAKNLNVYEEPGSQYVNAVTRVKEYIKNGDVFQVNLSRLWHIDNVGLEAADIYAHLRETNPSPFAALTNFEGFSIISSSPERLVRVENGLVETRPIAGTRKRDKNKSDDDALKEELIRHPKERAEHIMLIDLERNDLGRICEPGTIEVNELMVLESYAHVHHIVSNVQGKLRKDVLPGDVLKAVFPGGTITGCPKERCMAIISELETEARGTYTGSLGYLTHQGDMDLNILIRSMTLVNDTLSFRAGAGLVADSVAEKELEETQHKARGLLLALQ